VYSWRGFSQGENLLSELARDDDASMTPVEVCGKVTGGEKEKNETRKIRQDLITNGNPNESLWAEP
jgi:hypothetical protein